MKTKLKRTILFTALLALSLCVTCGAAFAADGKIQVGVNTKYGQTEARAMLSMINKFRTGPDAWVWNADNRTKTTYHDLEALTYDYGLEKAAMRRAVEIALEFSHDRPNDEACFSIYQEYGLAMYAGGENIAAGQRSVAAVFKDWQETNDDYHGQGHRRNMLSEDFTAVGIGHAVCNGRHFWVQEFGSPTSSAPSTIADNSAKVVPIEISQSRIVSSSATANVGEVALVRGKTASLPKLDTRIRMIDTWGGAVPVEVPYTWTLADPQYASISNGTLIGNKEGKTTLTTSVMLDKAKTVTVPVQVVDAPKRVVLTKTKSTKTKTLKLTWKRDKKATGYQVMIATDKKFKKNKKIATIKKNTTVSKTFTKLKRKKVYYAKARAYKQVGKTKIYGAYSKIKKARVK